jgi:hypothetical protein
VKHTKTGKIYQRTTTYTKWPKHLPNCHKIFEMTMCKIFHS